MGIRAYKGHGTGNDFIVVPPMSPADGVAVPDFDAREVALLCDRHLGIGADGLIRVVPTVHADDAFVRAQAGQAPWFMDYRNADGSLAEMCGNGVRVFVRVLLREGLAEPGELAVATRGGVRRVHVASSDADVAVAMGVGTPEAPSRVTISEGRSFPASGMYFPNPHAVILVDYLDDAGALHAVPEWHPHERYPAGVNVEFVRIAGPRHLQVRIHERGVGETMSCGTGVCAAVAVARDAMDDTAADTWRVDVPGGTVWVDVDRFGETTLRGSAVLVATLDIDEAWLRATP